MAESGSLTVYPAEFLDGYSFYEGISGQNNPIGKGSNNVTSGCIAYLCTGSRAETDLYYSFNLSAIPSEAEINSVSCVVRAFVSSATTSYISAATAQLYAAFTAKGSSTSIRSTSQNTTYTLNTGTWTRAELNNCRLKLQAVRGTSQVNSTSYYLGFYGATLTVTYTVNSEKFMLKLGGSWTDVARVFKKVSGIWVEQTDLANVIEDGVRYQNGGEIISPKKTVTITGSGNDTYSYVKINGVTYTSPATIEVSNGDVIEATVSGGGFGSSSPSISVDGAQKVSTAGTYKHTVNSDCTVALYYGLGGMTYYGTIAITTG